jgi:hypothetical protein
VARSRGYVLAGEAPCARASARQGGALPADLGQAAGWSANVLANLIAFVRRLPSRSFTTTTDATDIVLWPTDNPAATRPERVLLTAPEVEIYQARLSRNRHCWDHDLFHKAGKCPSKRLASPESLERQLPEARHPVAPRPILSQIRGQRRNRASAVLPRPVSSRPRLGTLPRTIEAAV